MAVGKVIKGDSAAEVVVPDRQSVRAGPRPVVRSEDYEAQKSASDIVADAKLKAEAILAEAEAQKEKLFEEAQAKGREVGLAQMTEQIAKAKLQAGELLAQHEQDVILLACKIAEKIIGRDVQRDPEVLVELCATALESVRTAKAIVLRVSPKAAAVLRSHYKELMGLIGRSVDVAIKEDGDVQDMGCIIQTEFGTVDATLSTQLDMIKQVLLESGAKPDGPA